MPGYLADVALLTERRYIATEAPPGDWYLGNILGDDGLLADALRARGLSSARLDWSDPGVDWSRYRCAVFRTTWDYYERAAEFRDWLARIETATTLFNPPDVVRWSLDKHYLADLDRQRVSIVETAYLEKGCGTTLAEVLDRNGWNAAVVKPCISATARETYRFDRGDVGEVEPVVARLLESEAMMVQPFQESIPEEGEDSLIFLDGWYSHAVRKVAKPGDFRVQDDHGGTVHAYQPTGEQIALGEEALAAVSSRPVYARVDMVRDNHGRQAIMELELIEPELFFRFHPPAAEALAAAIARHL